jgi:GH25 family lysozyme M1 (1,4-beta-N-acetylmuramidase)
MRTAAFRRATRIIAAAAGLGAAVLVALPATAAAHPPAAAHPAAAGHAPAVRTTTARTPAPRPAQRGDRYNTGATHSPQVLRALAGHPGRPVAGKIAGALQGVDVASYQHPNGAAINWAKVAASGIQFAAVKATEGDYYQNPYALKDLSGAKAAGLSVMAYAFGIPNGNGSSASPAVQADYLLAYLAKTGGPPPAVLLDIEYNPYGSECYGLSQSAMVSWIAAFDAEIRAKTGQDPIIYTPPSWWQTCTGGVARFRQVPLWVPDPNSKSSPILPAGWANWAFWQYSSTGTVSGIAAKTDLDQLNPGLIPLLDPGFQHEKAGTPVSIQVSAADPVSGQVLTFTATGLPPGTSISAAGLITGTPATAGRYRVIVHVTDGNGLSGSVVFGWAVH